MKWVCASFSPGMTVRRPASMTRVFSSRKEFSSASEPTPTMLSPLIAMAAASGCRGLSVATRPFTISTSAGPACASGAQPPSAVTPRTAPELRKNCRRPYVICPPRGALARQPVVHGDVFRLQRSEEHTSELQSPCNLVCRLLLEKKKQSSTNDHDTRRKGIHPLRHHGD